MKDKVQPPSSKPPNSGGGKQNKKKWSKGKQKEKITSSISSLHTRNAVSGNLRPETALIPPAIRRSLISTPARSLAKPSSNTGASDVLGSSLVYVRRQSGSKRKDKEMTFDMPATKIHSSSRYGCFRDSIIASVLLQTPSKSSCTPSFIFL
ncbi:hypothetical protein LINPERPRIM_LOCUS38187 [Linum perenne]